MEENVFLYTHTVSFDEIDYNGNIKLSQIMRHTQETAGLHLASIGFSYTFLRENDIVFLLSRYSIEISKYPKLGETFHIKTWHIGPKGAQFIRFFNIYDSDMNKISSISSAWPVINFSTRHVMRPSMYPYDLPIGSGIESSISTPSAIKIGDNLEKIFSRYIGYSVIDVNGHLNNAAYTDIITDGLKMLMDNSEIQALSINYCKEVFAGQYIDIYTKTENDTIYFEGIADDIISFKATVLLKTKGK